MIYVHSLGRASRYYPQHAALVVDGAAISFKALHERVRNVAAALVGHGLAAGMGWGWFLGTGSQDFLEPKAQSGKSLSQLDSRSGPAVHRELFVNFGQARAVVRAAIVFILSHSASVAAQRAPVSPDHPWHGLGEARIEAAARNSTEPGLSFDQEKTYSLAELIDLAESHNPETRVAWERARAQAAAWGLSRSELYPTVAAAALAGVDRGQAYLADRFFRQTIGDLQVELNLNYTIFDFGARAGRINAAQAESFAANFAFNDTHREVIYRVEQAYYQVLNASGQEEVARANLSNAQAVQQAAEERLNNGLATLPDVLEARSATAQAEYELQAVLGAEEIAHGNLAKALGTTPQSAIRVQPLRELTIPNTIDDTVNSAMDRALAQRPDLLQRVADVQAAKAKVKEARAGLLSLTEFHRYANRTVALLVATAVSLGTNSRPGGWHGL
jgi:Outer membrane efflux protein